MNNFLFLWKLYAFVDMRKLYLENEGGKGKKYRNPIVN